ncbi:MAG: BrnA antitoxin family protein [Spirochaetaceae bacterium]|nr:BrnA antitoxin family protein [Spirochaetaceae bacterium]
MDMMKVTVRDGQKPTKEQVKEIRAAVKEAKKHPVYDPDCPPSTPEALAEFAAKARELRQNRRRIKPAVTIRIMPEVLAKYKALGKGYTGIMADVLNYVADNPEILSKIH